MTYPLRLLFAACIFPFYFSKASIALADSIRLKNGDTLSGTIISFNSGLCIFDTIYGSAVRIPIQNIQSINTDDHYDIQFTNGEQATGQLKSGPDNQTLLESPTFG